MLLNKLGPLLGAIVLSQCVSSSVLPRKGDDPQGHKWINHDAVAAFPQSQSDGLTGDMELRFNPALWVSGGCDPYPAVDRDGNLGGGLKPTEGGRSGCDKGGLGQVYARRGRSQGHEGIMYTYYTPKVRWAKGAKNGHRHYWASVVIWVKREGCKVNDLTSIVPVGVSFTTDHEKWGTVTTKSGNVSYRAGGGGGAAIPTHAKLQIHDNAISPFKSADTEAMFERTLVSWTSLQASAQQALNEVQYEKTKVPFNDANFQPMLDAAYQGSLFTDSDTEEDCDSVGPPKFDDPATDF
ncbi:necrosis inducing protein-domain-containing protein [Colletotrichum cereale]|nr:necrosis inducing protein-domain-containing protein [Colletotrichum cereale]